MTGDSKGVDMSRDTEVEALVMGAVPLKQADTDVLDKTGPSRDARVEYLLSHDYVAVEMKGLREVSAGATGSE
jgi:hypothetical protein